MSRPPTMVFVSGLSRTMDESALLQAFQPFGEIIEVHMPKHRAVVGDAATATTSQSAGQHRGFGFVAFASANEAEDAMDNMHLNEIHGRIVSVTPGKPSKGGAGQGGGGSGRDAWRPVWEDEEWIKEHGSESQDAQGSSIQ